MIKNELKKRITTSIILFISILLLILINEVIFMFAIFIVSVISFYEWNNINIPFFYKKKKRAMLSLQLCGLFFILIFFISSLFIYKTLGDIFFIFVILTCSSSDIGGFVLGKTIGGVKLTKISPNKTVAGSIGSLMFSIIPLIIFNSQTYFIFEYNFSLQNIFFCIIISLTNQIGDLFISYFKRLNKVKNTGNILPGHGGLLDRVDGIIFAIPISLILIMIQFI